MSEKRARYDGPSGTGVDLTVPLENGEYRSVHVDQGAQLPTDFDGNKIAASYRDSLLLQEDWSEVKQATGSDTTKKDGDSR